MNGEAKITLSHVCARTSDDAAVAAECEVLGLHPKRDPMGEDHHTDAEFALADFRLGNVLSWVMGSLFADERWQVGASSAEQWARVARALRVHGLTIRDEGPPHAE